MNFAFDVDENVFLVATRNAALLGLINEEIVIESSSSEYSERYDSYSEDSESEQSDSDASSTAEGGTTSACDSLSGTFDAALKLNEEKILEFIHIDVSTLSDGLRPSCSPLVDVTFTNPPFGTKNNTGIDMLFLKTAIDVSHFHYLLY